MSLWLALLFVIPHSFVFAEKAPSALEGVGINPVMGAQLDLQLQFQDENGKTVKLAEYFNGKLPVVLVLNYYGCPMLCGLLLNAARDSFLASDWRMGEHYKVVTISFDPKEDAALAAAKKASMLQSLGDPARVEAAKAHWHFLVGDAANIKAVTEALGFQYRWIEAEKQFAHGAAMYFLSPKGKISRLLFGLSFPPKDFKFALIEASEGKVGSIAEKLVSFCYHYDPKDNSYAILASRIMKLGGALTVAILVLVYLVLFLRKRERKS